VMVCDMLLGLAEAAREVKRGRRMARNKINLILL